MPARIFSTIQKRYTSVAEAAVVISCFTFFSQILGVLRDRLFAYYIGPGVDLDVYLAAFRVPDFVYVLLSTLISATILIPLLSKENDKNNETINSIFSFFLLITILFSLVVIILMPYLAPFIAPGFTAENTTKLVMLSRLMLFSPIILGVSNFIGSVNQYYKKFVGYAMAPVFYNFGIILGIIFFYNMFGIFGLGLGVLVGAFLHLCIQLITYKNSEYTLSFSTKINFKIVRDLISTSIPRTITLSLSSLLFIIITSVISYSEPGSISLITFALNIASVPLSLIGVPFATASFPYLVTLFKNKDTYNADLIIKNTMEKIIFWTIISVFLFMVYRAHIVRIILGTKLFSWEDTLITSALVLFFLTSILFQSLNQFFIRIYYAQNNTKRPLYVSLAGFFSTIVLLFLFTYAQHISLPESIIHFLKIPPRNNLHILYISLCYSLGTVVTTLLFVYFYVKDFKKKLLLFICKNIFSAVIHGFILACLCKYFLLIFRDFEQTRKLIGIMIQAGLSSFISIIIWLFYLFLLKNEHTDFIFKKIKSFFSSHKIILEETQEL